MNKQKLLYYLEHERDYIEYDLLTTEYCKNPVDAYLEGYDSVVEEIKRYLDDEN